MHGNQNGTRHNTQMNTFGGCSSLNIVKVAAERILIQLPAKLAVATHIGQQGMDHPAQGRAMRSAGEVIIKIFLQVIRPDIISQFLKDQPDFRFVKIVKSHQGICLFGNLKFIGRLPFRFQYAVKPVDITVFLTVIVPVKFFKSEVAVVLRNNAFGRNNNIQVPRNPFPFRKLLIVQTESGFYGISLISGKREDFKGFINGPYHHNIGVGIVAQSSFG